MSSKRPRYDVRLSSAPVWISVLLVGISVIEWLSVYSELPDYVASSFGGEGVPQGWTARRGFLMGYLVATAFQLVMLFVIPWALRRSDPSRTRVPNRDYWIAPERYPQTLSYIGNACRWMLVATLAFSAAVVHLVFEANLETGKLSVAFLWLLGAYFGYMFVWFVRFFRGFRRPANREQG